MSAPSLFGALQQALGADLDFHGSDGNYASHGWHPFPAKFPPQLPKFFIERLSDENDVVLDPMLGSGTTMVEALRLGRRAVGCDIDPLARMMAAAKIAPINPAQTLQTGATVIRDAQQDYSENPRRLQHDLKLRFDPKTADFVNYWFLPGHQLDLLALLQRIEELPSGGAQDFLKVVFSSTIIAKSGGVSLARDLAHTRPHRDVDKTPNSVFTEFAKRLERNVASLNRNEAAPAPSAAPQPALPLISETSPQSYPAGPASIKAASADNTGLPPDSIDLIVTSPPYANNAIDYMRAHKFSLVWFGWKIEDLTRVRAQYLGHDAAPKVQYEDLPGQCEKTLAKLAALDTKKAATLRRYFGEMSAVILEMQRVLKQGKPAVIVVGTSNLRGIDVETHKGLAAIGQLSGFHLAGIGVRRLDRDKRMMPARWGNRHPTQIEERMHEEYVIGLVKS